MAFIFCPLLLLNRNRNNLDVAAENRWLPTIREILQMGTTFALTCLAWVFFRAENIGHAVDYLSNLVKADVLPHSINYFRPFDLGPMLLLLVALEWLQRKRSHTFDIAHWPTWARYLAYYAMVFITIRFMGVPQEFIYFQF